MKIGDEVFVEEDWFLSPVNRTGKEYKIKMIVTVVDEESDYVELHVNKILGMKLSDLKRVAK